MVYRLILPDWAKAENPTLPKVREGEYSSAQLTAYNAQAYNIYFLPNHPSVYHKGTTVDGSQIDVFQYIFVDFDLKSKAYASKEAFADFVKASGPEPTFMVDTGNGIHAYWAVKGLDPMIYLRLCRRIMRKFNTDPAVGQIYQLMRVPGSINTKTKDSPKPCEIIYDSMAEYTAEEMDTLLDPITAEDEAHCQQHYAKTFQPKEAVRVDDVIPVKFKKLLRSNQEVKKIWAGEVEDRSVADYRLGHILFANSFSRAEAMSVLVNTSKAMTRAPVHRIGYAEGIADKIWTYEDDGDPTALSQSVKDILNKHGSAIRGERFPCYAYLDNTECGFRLGHVIGLVAGAKVGKTALSLNMFKGFVQNNPNYDHMFVALEQPASEIANLWQKLCGSEVQLHDRVHVLSNYESDGTYRNLSLDEIRDYILEFQKDTGRKIGCVVIDHIGVLKRVSEDSRISVEDICHQMKSFAIATNTLLVMQSQAPREKAGGGDLELDKSAAYGTVFFESYVDYLITLWQPLKRAYTEKACPTVMAFKFCAIRHKNKLVDLIQEDVCYRVFFEPGSGIIRELTENEEKSFDYFNSQCVNKRKQDRKTELIPYKSVKWNATDTNREDPRPAQVLRRVSKAV